MPVYEWQHRQTKYFGRMLFPLATIQLEGRNGVFQPIAVQVDSGAVISLLRRSLADFLGIALSSGTRIEMSGVGGATTVAYVHSIKTKFDQDLLDVRYAIAESETVPILLGRLDVFDTFQVHFDPIQQHTKFCKAT